MTVTAGMVRGTPDWQLDRDYESETAEMLEKHFNSEDDFPRSNVTGQMSKADGFLGQAISAMCRAADLADGFGKADPIDELIRRLEDLRCDIGMHRNRLEGKQ